MRTFNLENRLIQFSVSIIRFTEHIPKSFAVLHLSKQIIRSSTSSALNYAESMGSESDKDFIHKQSLVLKELRESYVCLKIMNGVYGEEMNALLLPLIQESDELVKITFSSIATVKKRLINSVKK